MHGDKLASVGSFPDYMLTVWDWQQERTVLRTKAFSQEVFTVQFSPSTDGRLTTCGMGHIRFWKMASTFTGLKLQGAIGKFGKVRLPPCRAAPLPACLITAVPALNAAIVATIAAASAACRWN